MIRVIMGKKGSGKTKQMIDMINNAVQTEHGNVVCIERGSKLTYDIHYQIRLVEASQLRYRQLCHPEGLCQRSVRRQL